MSAFVFNSKAQYDAEWFLMQVESIENNDSLFFDAENAEKVDVDKLDSLVHAKIWGKEYLVTNRLELNIYDFSEGEIPVYPDSVYENRVAELNKRTPINLVYNHVVNNYIKLYSNRKRNLTARLLGLGHFYFPLFEEYLDKYDMPLELKYLAIVESALQPQAGSRAGAKGLWQFMYSTGKMYGLQSNSFIDDRFDPVMSTIAACEYLTDLYDIYGDWSLALAAYNSGPGNVNRAIRNAGGVKSYWAVWPFLPRETRGYVPAFIAVNYIMNYPAEHNIFPIDPGQNYYDIDTVKVNDVLSFEQVAEMFDMELKTIKFLNPRYKKGIIPANDGNEYYLRLPYNVAADYREFEKEVYAYKTLNGIKKDKLLAEIEKAKSRRVHIIRSGENLGSIAKKYRTSVSKLRRWNNLRGSMIYPGQKLVVFSPGYVRNSKKTVKSNNGFHKVRRGETLGLIAKTYRVRVSDLKRWNNLRGSVIRVNQKLIVKSPIVEYDGTYVLHTVRSGDTLWDIAKKYKGVSVKQIKKLNKLSNSRGLKVGQKLKILKKA